jgi:hypothetical protein
MRYALALLSGMALFSLADRQMHAGEGTSPKQTYSLIDRKDATDLARVKAQLEVSGTAKMAAEGQEKTSTIKVSASLVYDERRMPAQGDSRLSLRHYDRAEAVLRVDQGEFRPRLRPARQLVGVVVKANRAVLYSPTGALTREELDLVDIPGNTAVLPQLLPAEPLAIGESWKVDHDALAMFLGIDAVSASDVACKLWQVTPGRIARVRFSGHVNGAVHGVATEIQLKGRFDYDLAARRFTEFEMTVDEDRGISPIGPGLKVTCELKLQIDGIASSQHVTADRAARLAENAPPSDPFLYFHWQSTGYHLSLSRLWHIVDERPHLLVLRLIERGELVAQCNISPGQPAAASALKKSGEKTPPPAARPKTLQEYTEQVRKALDKNFGKLVSTGQGTTAAGTKFFHVVADGQVQEVPVRWVYYLLYDDAGRHAGLVFTFEQKLASKFGTAGEKLIDQFRFVAASTASAAAPASKPVKTIRLGTTPKVKR